MLLRQAEHPLSDDVALHLVGSAGKTVAGSTEHMLGPRELPPLASVGHHRRPEQFARHIADAHEIVGREQLAQRTGRARLITGRIGAGDLRDHRRMQLGADVDIGDSLTDNRVLAHAERASKLDQVCRGAPLAAMPRPGRRPLEAEGRRCHAPAVVHIADAEGIVDPDPIEEDLVE